MNSSYKYKEGFRHVMKPTKTVSSKWHKHFAGSSYRDLSGHNGLNDHILNPHHQSCKRPISVYSWVERLSDITDK